MSKESYSIPAAPSARYDFQRNAIDLCTTNATTWKIPPEKITSITVSRTDYEQKYNIANNRSTQSPAATSAREAAWVVLEKDLVDLYDKYILNNDILTPEDKETLHIHSRGNSGGSASPAPTTTPIITFVVEEISVLHVVYADSSTPGKHNKPDNVAFCELIYKIDGEVPTSPDACTLRSNIARSREGIIFQPTQRGKNIYAYARWVNRNGKTGPWSGMTSAIIP